MRRLSCNKTARERYENLMSTPARTMISGVSAIRTGATIPPFQNSKLTYVL